MSRSHPHPRAALSGERGYTLIELVIGMALGTMLLLALFSFLQFTSGDVSRISSRTHADQAGRLAMEKIMLALHSACVAPRVTPIQSKSNATTLRFLSETSPLTAKNEPVSSLSTVKLHEIVYEPASGKVQGKLVEKLWTSSGAAPNFTFNEKEKPTVRTLLTGVKQSGESENIAIFRYYRYYQESDKESQPGQLDPTPMASVKEPEEAKNVTKVSVSFTVSPEGHEYTTFGNDRPVALEDSATFRLETSSEAPGTANLPCNQT